MKRALCAAMLVFLLVFPGLGITEGDDTIQLARTIYTLGRDESYETKLMLGSVVMNRVTSPWFPDTIREVLNQPHQFPKGTVYDDDSLRAAREIMRGSCCLPGGVVSFLPLEMCEESKADKLFAMSGNFGFYYE